MICNAIHAEVTISKKARDQHWFTSLRTYRVQNQPDYQHRKARCCFIWCAIDWKWAEPESWQFKDINRIQTYSRYKDPHLLINKTLVQLRRGRKRTYVFWCSYFVICSSTVETYFTLSSFKVTLPTKISKTGIKYYIILCLLSLVPGP